MTVALTMPRLGETVTEGTILKWLKHKGDYVKKDENIVEISTAKVETEIPSPVSGRVAKVIASEDETVPVGAELALIDETATEAGPAPAAPAPAPEAKAPKQPTPISAKARQPEQPTPAPAIAVGAEGQPAPAPAVKPPGVVPELGFVSPIVRKLAREHNVDLTQVIGTGAGGRITRQDVERLIELQKPAQPAAAAAAQPAPEAPKEVAPPVAVAPEYPNERIVPMNILRREIAQHMVRSHQISAHVTGIVEVDMTNVVKQRDKVKEAFKKREGFSLTFLPFVAKAAVDALIQFPMINARIIDEHNMALHDYVNLGIAVSIENGLIVPVVKHAEEMNLIGLAHHIHELAEKTRAGKLSLDEVTGSTFTITNPGSLGSLIQTPIINQPNVAILSLEGIQKRPVVIDEAIAIRSMVYMPLTYDHRLIDGAMATQFLNRIKQDLETWDFSPDLANVM